MSEDLHAGAVFYVKDVERVAAFYASVLGLHIAGRDESHVLLESPRVQLVILSVPPDIAATITIATPPVRRAMAAIKPVFFVPSLARVRAAVEAGGGVMNPVSQEWSFHGCTVCDGLDPEGNVIQFREQAS